MGAKCHLLAIGPQRPREAIAEHTEGGRSAAESVARRVLGPRTTYVRTGNVSEDCYPRDAIFVATFGETVVVASYELEQTEHLWHVLMRDGSGVYKVLMHSVVDTAAFEIEAPPAYSRQVTVAAEMSLDDVAASCSGVPLPFETPFWRGDRDEEDLTGHDMVAFSPMELGEEALRWTFGFVIESDPHPDDIDAFAVPFHGFTPAPGQGRSWWRRLLDR